MIQSMPRWPLILLLALILSIPLHAQTQPPTATTTAPSKLDQYLINGRVNDATTTKPIDKFTLILRPAKTPFWQPHTLKRYAGGNTFKFPHPRGWNDILIRVWADGYKPSVVRVAEDQDQVEIWLKPAQTIKGRVIATDGKPLSGAHVALAGISQEVSITHDKLALSDLSRELDRKIAQTDAAGAFELPDDPEARQVIVVHQDGYAQADLGDLDDPIAVKPWGQIKGQLLRGSSPAPGWQIDAHRAAPQRSELPYIHHRTTARTDSEGRFTIDKLAPGLSQISVNYASGNNVSPVVGLATSIEIKRGETVNLTLGGEGRPVTGKLVAANGASVDWSKVKLRIGLETPSLGFIVDSPIESGFREAQREFFAGGLTSTYHHALIPAPDGAFKIDRLPQGRYELTGFGRQFEVTPMPGGKTDEPLDLGEIKIGPP